MALSTLWPCIRTRCCKRGRKRCVDRKKKPVPNPYGFGTGFVVLPVVRLLLDLDVEPSGVEGLDQFSRVEFAGHLEGALLWLSRVARDAVHLLDRRLDGLAAGATAVMSAFQSQTFHLILGYATVFLDLDV